MLHCNVLHSVPELKLNDDCLLLVMSYLSIKDRIRVERGMLIHTFRPLYMQFLQHVLVATFSLPRSHKSIILLSQVYCLCFSEQEMVPSSAGFMEMHQKCDLHE